MGSGMWAGRSGERTTRGQPEERKYHWSNLLLVAMLEELVGYAHRRFAVKQFLKSP
jgi:hypothetical protein